MIAWDDQRIFLAVLEEGSLSGAARRLGLSHPTVRSRIDVLEHQLGTVLFVRSGTGLAPTDTALSLRDAARAMALASDLFVRQASAPEGGVAGTVRLSVSDFMGGEVVPEMLVALREAYPGLRVELVLDNRPADLLAQEVDVAVRAYAPTQGALVARRVGRSAVGLYASPAYLARRGVPVRASDLGQHDLIGPDRSSADWAVVARLGDGVPQDRFVLCSDSHPAQIAAARAGVGIAAVQVVVGDRDPSLVRVLPDTTVTTLDIWLVMHETLSRTPRVRAVFDTLGAAFARLTAHQAVAGSGL